MRAQFVLSEMLVGLRRNLTLSVAVVITVAVSLAFAGSGLLIRRQVDMTKGYWYDRVEASIFLADSVTEEQRQSLDADLRANPEVERVFYETKEQAFERFKDQFRNSPAIVENTTPDVLPESFRVKLKDPERFDVLSSAFTGRPGVDEIVNQRELLQGLIKPLKGVQVFALCIAAIQAAAAVLLVANIIRVAAFTRRRETGIMRLVGASNFYIQLPFLLEGAFAGLVGALLAVVSLFVGRAFFVDRVLRPAFGAITPFVGPEAVWSAVPLVMLAGLGLAATASFVTLRKYLRV